MSADEDTRVIPPADDCTTEHVPALVAALILEGVYPTTVERAVARAGSLDMGARPVTRLVRAFANEQAERLASGGR